MKLSEGSLPACSARVCMDTYMESASLEFDRNFKIQLALEDHDTEVLQGRSYESKRVPKARKQAGHSNLQVLSYLARQGRGAVAETVLDVMGRAQAGLSSVGDLPPHMAIPKNLIWIPTVSSYYTEHPQKGHSIYRNSHMLVLPKQGGRSRDGMRVA